MMTGSVEDQVIVCIPLRQMLDFLPVAGLIIFSNDHYQCGVICKYSGTGTALPVLQQQSWEKLIVPLHHGQDGCGADPQGFLTAAVQHLNLHLGLRPTFHHKRQRNSASGGDSKCDFFIY
ncbi:hypothetical protein ILYODFUR_027999 [Ilyodon furcidens]|uniref:Uncharacterized protein n=1 Tax=Ilyodon furcidens TaxID=33524 RepID=A0ABV0UC22_9TELE